MANVVTRRTYVLDTAGVVSKVPIYVVKAVLFPNAAGDSVTFMSWNENDTADTTMADKTVTATADPYLQSTGNFESTEVTAGDVIKIIRSSTGNNLDTFSVATRDNDNQVTLDGYPTLTAESTKVYTWKVWTPFVSFKLTSPGTEAISEILDFSGENNGKGRWFPNLMMDALSSSAVIHLFIG
jgi:archaellin